VEEWYEPDEGGSPESSGGRIRCEVKGIGHPTSDAATAAWVTIENPTRANSVNSTLLGALANVFRRLASRDETLRCVVLTGGASPDDKGAAAFCGGADIREMSSLTTTGGARSFITAVHEACRAVRELEVVTVARIDGVTFGAGLEIAAACDFRYATGTSHFGMPEVALGIPSVVEARLLANIVGWQKTKELVYFGRVIDAATAASWGLVDGVDDNLDSLVYPTLSGIAANGPRAMRAQKRLVQTWEDCDLQAGIAAGVDSFAGMWDDGGVEPKKYMGAFLEQRRAKKAGGK
jgi:enoyl-CoA hydratase/carnithine racemase